MQLDGRDGVAESMDDGRLPVAQDVDRSRARAVWTTSPWTPPREIAEFRLERPLGGGATSEVWLATDTLLDRVVALKIASVAPSAEMLLRFRVEARVVAKMHHPNLLAIHHVGEVDEHPFLVTEFLSGQSLDHLEGPLDPERVVTIGLDLARGLSAAHQAGVLHRDIKPANAFLCGDGIAKLIDFGLAKLSDGPRGAPESPSPVAERSSTAWALRDPSLVSSSPGELDSTQVATTLDGSYAGTPLYMAPEIWRGEAATRSADIYSLGALLYELLAGEPPCNGEEIAELYARVLMGRIEPLAERSPAAPPALAALVMACLRGAPEERPTAGAVCEALAGLLPRASVVPGALDDPAENPYRGLLTFGPEHRALFFGRESDAAAVIGELRANPFVLVTGASGAGKSSLVRAGVAPYVERGALAAGTEWKTIVVVPGRRPTEALAEAFAAVLGVGEREIVAMLAKSRARLADELRAARARVLLVLDQLEEIWTLAAPGDREAFFEIVAAITLSAPLMRVLATLRADFLGRLEDMGELQPQALRALVVLRPMTPEGLRRAIVAPAARRGVAFEPALADHLVARAEGGSLPLLEFALGILYDRRDPAKSSIGLSDLEALGGIEGALAMYADSALARLPASERGEARRLLLALVTVERTRWRREEHDLLVPGDDDARAALDALVEARLVIASAGERGAAYEVAHEALLSGWPALRAWLDEDAQARETLDRVRRAAAEWERVGRAAEALFGEHQLAELDALARSSWGGCEAFIDASRVAVRRARLRHLTLRVGAPLGALALAAAVAGGIRWSERRQAHAFVAARLHEADPMTRELRDLDAQVEAARADAFAGYDAGDTSRGAARWRDALALARRESDAFVAAHAPLGLALARDPLDPVARARAADVAYLWLLAAERDREPDVVRDLEARLAQLDDDGSRRARLAAPASLMITTSPPGARVVLHPVRVQADGRRAEDEGRPMEPGAPMSLSPGSYLLEASAPGRYPTRYPVFLRRAQDERVEIPLPASAAVPPGFVFVPAGDSLLGVADVEGVRSAFAAPPEHAVHVDAFLIAENEVTEGDYLEYLASLPATERGARSPQGTGLRLAFDLDGTPTLTAGAATARRGEPLCRPKRSVRRCQDWLRFPVAGIAWEDAEGYLAWLGGRVPGARFCSAREWERAARGADGRLYPHGDVLHPGDANFGATYAVERRPGRNRRDRVLSERPKSVRRPGSRRERPRVRAGRIGPHEPWRELGR